MDDLVVGHLVIPAAELDEEFTTSGGPGGQHANRNETAVRLRLDVMESSLPDNVKRRLVERLGTTVEVVSADERSQSRNRETARRRMVEKLESALHEGKPRRRTQPTRASRERRLTQKKRRADIKRQRRRPPSD